MTKCLDCGIGESKHNTYTFTDYFVLIGKTISMVFPMILLAMFISKVPEAEIELRDSLYLLLGTLGIMVYWIMNFWND